MNLTKKLDLIEYIYEPITLSLYLYRVSETSPFILIDKTDNRQKEFTIEHLVNYLEVTDIDQIKLHLILDSILTQQALFHKMIMDDNLKTINMTYSELQQSENELKSTLKDITKGYVKKRLYLVENET